MILSDRTLRAPRLGVRRGVVAALVLVCSSALAAGCSYRPARFAERPPVWLVDDARPIPLPRLRRLPKELYYSDVYVRRAMVRALDPNRTPPAADVNCLDEVPRSSWYRPLRDTSRPLAGYERYGPPVLPWRWPTLRTGSAVVGATVMLDARGLRFELQRDLPDRPEMRTAASAIASRLLWSLGYFAPEVWVTRGPAGERVSATRWADGVDLGPTPTSGTRSDDPNDLVPHQDRRSLRVLGMVAAWLALARLERDMLRDSYVGIGGGGHVRHHLVGWSGSLGVDGVLAARDEASNPDRQNDNLFFRLATLGLSPKPPPPDLRSEWPSLGAIDGFVDPGDYGPSPPFPPRYRLTEPDAYWLAKRLAELPERTIDEAILAGELSSPEARHRLGVLLRARRKQVVDFGMSLVTPCEALRVRPGQGGQQELVLLDRAIAFGSASPSTGRYELALLDAEGNELRPPVEVRGAGPHVLLPLPTEGWPAGEYRIARVVAIRSERRAPRPLEVHLIRRGGALRILGVRH